jgi:hypothetical protein
MTWGRCYAAKSYLLSTLWLSPLVACVLAQLTYRLPYVLNIDFGAIPGFIYTEQGRISALEINITMNLTFIVFTFGSMLVAIQIASAQLSPRIIATALLRNNVIRVIVGLFAYGLVVSLGARNRTETIPNFVISIAALWGLVSVVAFLFLIDYAARLLRPLSIVRRMAEQGLKVFADVYPEAAGSEPDLPRLRSGALPGGARLRTPASRASSSRSIPERWSRPRGASAVSWNWCHRSATSLQPVARCWSYAKALGWSTIGISRARWHLDRSGPSSRIQRLPSASSSTSRSRRSRPRSTTRPRR